MKDGKCPMCKSTEVYVNETHHIFLDIHQNLAQKQQDPLGSVQGGASVYMCKNCGFTAFYVDNVVKDFDDLPAKRGWKKVS